MAIEYKYLEDTNRARLIEARIRAIETEHFHITSMLAVGNENRDPAQGPVIGPPDGPPPKEHIKNLEAEHTYLLAELDTLPAPDTVDFGPVQVTPPSAVEAAPAPNNEE